MFSLGLLQIKLPYPIKLYIFVRIIIPRQIGIRKKKLQPIMPPRRSKSWTQCLAEVGIALTIVIVLYLYAQYTFPSQFRHLYPQEFQSHEFKDLSEQSRSWTAMQTLVFNSTLASQCEDIEITKKDIAYCVNEKNQIISIDVNKGKIKKLHQLEAQVQEGNVAYGLRLSRDQKLLYIAHATLGLCQFDIKNKKFTQLFSFYQGKPLIALNSIETHPKKPNILYVTQTSSQIPLKNFQIDLLMNLPHGRVFEFNKKTGKLSLLADGLYFANGIVFQQYDGEDTVLVAESNRLRLTRIWVSGENRGKKQVAADKLDIYLDNMKANEKGEIWVAGPSMRSHSLQYADHHPWIRRLLSRIPPERFQSIVEDDMFGGLKIKFSNKNKKYKLDYVLWQKIPNWKFTTSINERNNRLYLSSLKTKGIMVVDDFKNQLKKSLIKQEDKQEGL